MVSGKRIPKQYRAVPAEYYFIYIAYYNHTYRAPVCCLRYKIHMYNDIFIQNIAYTNTCWRIITKIVQGMQVLHVIATSTDYVPPMPNNKGHDNVQRILHILSLTHLCIRTQ